MHQRADVLSEQTFYRRKGEESAVVRTTVDGPLAGGGQPAADAKLFHPVDQGCPLDAKPLGGTIAAADDPIACFKRVENMISLYLRKTAHGHIGFPGRVEGLQFGGGGA